MKANWSSCSLIAKVWTAFHKVLLSFLCFCRKYRLKRVWIWGVWKFKWGFWLIRCGYDDFERIFGVGVEVFTWVKGVGGVDCWFFRKIRMSEMFIRCLGRLFQYQLFPFMSLSIQKVAWCNRESLIQVPFGNDLLQHYLTRVTHEFLLSNCFQIIYRSSSVFYSPITHSKLFGNLQI